MRPARAERVTLGRALDEIRFGPARTLDLRSSMPPGTEAASRAEAWLRERQMAKAGDVLIITGRGKGSAGGVGVVHLSIGRLLSALRRRGVVVRAAEQTPGSFVVTLAPIRALFETPPRSRSRAGQIPASDPAELAGLDGATREQLRRLAERSLESLGAPRRASFVQSEMLRQFAILASAVAPDETDREGRLKFLIGAAAAAFDDGD